MNQQFQGWHAVAEILGREAEKQSQLGDQAARLNAGQRASVREIASRIPSNGVLVADEVGMGKTRIAVEVARSVTSAGGRVAILVPPGLGYQWQAELRDGGINDVAPILRSLNGYLAAWEDNGEQVPRPWFEEPVVVVSHAFTNWRFGENPAKWRWALLPELYARWRKATQKRLPRNYGLDETPEAKRLRWASNAAQSIADNVPTYQKYAKHPVRRRLDRLLKEISWPRPRDASEYSQRGKLRPWLEECVGFGLGVFDLVIIDEAHKSRGEESSLSRLLEEVIVSANGARRVALTATPVELDVRQWSNTLRRLKSADLETIQQAIEDYAVAVKRLQRAWRTSPEVRENFKQAADAFQSALSPYLLRRDKREDPDVLRFKQASNRTINEYRREQEIVVTPNDLPLPWRKAVCAAEALSLVARQTDDLIAKRLRLTLANGHGISVWLDEAAREDDDAAQERYDENSRAIFEDGDIDDAADGKRLRRVDWWRQAISPAFVQGVDSLYHHPAIVKAAEAIEEATCNGEKVLVFGRFVRPLRTLVELLNAREMLRRLQNDQPWPQEKVRGDGDGDLEGGDWPAVTAAHAQLKDSLGLGALDKLKLDETLGSRYRSERIRLDRFRRQLVSNIEQGLKRCTLGSRVQANFEAFKRSIAKSAQGETEGALVLVARAMSELLENPGWEPSSSDYANAFQDLIFAVCDRDDGDDERAFDVDEAAERWQEIETHLGDEYRSTRGRFARLMYGGTRPESRRMIQLAFNRPSSFLRVLVAQSLVGREGLNLHKACRIVVLLHPEWNPGVVEQQIGRVDRVASHWCRLLDEAIEDRKSPDELPRIEIRPVIFRGTYDEHNWQVLRTRWNDLRAQLHGVVIPPSEECDDEEGRKLIDEICRSAPNFSPTRKRDAYKKVFPFTSPKQAIAWLD